MTSKILQLLSEDKCILCEKDARNNVICNNCLQKCAWDIKEIDGICEICSMGSSLITNMEQLLDIFLCEFHFNEWDRTKFSRGWLRVMGVLSLSKCSICKNVITDPQDYLCDKCRTDLYSN